MESTVLRSQLELDLSSNDVDLMFDIGEAGSHWKVRFTTAYNNYIIAHISYDGEFPAWSEATYAITGLRRSINKKCDELVGSISVNGIDTYNGRLRAVSLQCPSNIRYLNHPIITLQLTIIEHYGEFRLLNWASDEEERSTLSFDEPRKTTDAVLVVDGKRVHVNKGFLATNSAYFEALFYGDFAERNQCEIELKDVDHDKFIELLRVIHPECKLVTKENIEVVLEMASFFDCKCARLKCVHFLCNDHKLPLFERLRLADKHGLTEVVDSMLECNITDEKVILAACKWGHEKLSDHLKSRLFTKLGKLQNAQTAR